MPKRFVSDLQVGDSIKSTFLAKSKSLRERRPPAQGQYLTLRLADKSGEIEGKVWDNVSVLETRFEAGDFVEVTGRVGTYRDQKELTISDIVPVDEASVEWADFLPHTQKDIAAMWKQLGERIKALENPHLTQLLFDIFSDSEVARKYQHAPASTWLHHTFIGGLLEHVLEILHLCDALCDVYSNLDRDLLVTGAILHDIGKIEELTYERGFDYTDEGRLIGHLVQGEKLVSAAIDKMNDFPQDLRRRLLHMILSHHGEPNFGTVQRPMTPEAVALFHIDNLVAKVNGYFQAIERESDPTKAWTEHIRLFDVRIYRGQNSPDNS